MTTAAKKSPTKTAKNAPPPEGGTPNAVILQMEPEQLTLAAELAAVPMMGAIARHYEGNAKAADLRAELIGERQGTLNSLDDIGIQEPLKVTLSKDGKTGKVWDGRHRLEWALSRVVNTVPVIHVTEDVGRKLMEASVIGRRHWSKGQRAFLGVICHPEVVGITVGRPKKEQPMTRTDLACHLGISADLVDQAVAIYKAFHAPGAKPGSPEAIEAADCKAKYEMSIWAGAGLGAVLAGIGGGKATHGKERKGSDWAALDKPLGTMSRLSKLWKTWDETERTKAQRLIVVRIQGDAETEGWSPEFCLALSEALAAAEPAI